jgi:hypothetical protein
MPWYRFDIPDLPDPKPFREFLDDYGAIECEAPTEADHVAGSNLVD